MSVRAFLVLLALLLPAALAEHEYSHRVVVDGRLTGADGLPLPGRNVTFFAEGAALTQPCAGVAQRDVTDEWGDFSFCWRAGALPASLQVGARSGGASAREVADAATRRTTLHLVDATANGTAPPGWERSYRIDGRVWRAGATSLEGVDVHGVVVPGVAVNVTLLAPGVQVPPLQRETGAHGDYEATLELPAGVDPANATILVEALGTTMPRRLDTDADARRARVDVRLWAEEGKVFFPESGVTPPGTTTPRVSPVLVGLGLAVAAGLALAVARVARR